MVVFEPSLTGSAAGTISVTAGLTTASIALSGSGVTSSHAVKLAWVASNSPSVVGYYVERGTTPGGPYQILNSSPDPGTSYVDSTVQGGNEYFYVIVSVNNGGHESLPSAQVSATIP